MRINRIVAVVVGLACLTAGAGVAYEATQAAPISATQVPNAATAARTALPGLTAATSEPTLDGIGKVQPRPGTVAHLAGPFDDRFTLDTLVFDGTRVSGRVLVTSDVSDILELEVLAGFYDARGELLGTNRFVYHLVEESQGSHTAPPSEVRSFSTAVPKGLRGRAVSAAVGVPVLVNE